MQTLQLGVSTQLYFLELDTYEDTGQPCLLLRPYMRDGAAIILTYQAPMIDLRAYDADFGMRRRHLLLRMSGAYEHTYKYLTEAGICNPVEGDAPITDGAVYARVCHIDLAYCVIAPSES